MEKLQNIKWKQNGENLTIYWDWYDESVEKVLVYWKKREFQENSYGIAFGDPIFKTPGMKTGSVSQKIGTRQMSCRNNDKNKLCFASPIA